MTGSYVEYQQPAEGSAEHTPTVVLWLRGFWLSIVRASFVLSILIGCCLAIIFFYAYDRDFFDWTEKWAARDIRIRYASSPGREFECNFVIRRGTRVRVRSIFQNSDWYQIYLGGKLLPCRPGVDIGALRYGHASSFSDQQPPFLSGNGRAKLKLDYDLAMFDRPNGPISRSNVIDILARGANIRIVGQVEETTQPIAGGRFAVYEVIANDRLGYIIYEAGRQVSSVGRNANIRARTNISASRVRLGVVNLETRLRSLYASETERGHRPRGDKPEVTISAARQCQPRPSCANDMLTTRIEQIQKSIEHN